MTGARHLYLHLPFCASRCGYCAFVVEVGSLDRRDAYLDALLAELEREGGRLGPLETVYLGGGTPSLMGPGRIARLLGAVRPHLAPGAEVSLEANPETVGPAELIALREAGVTRLSIGVQSLRPHVLRALERGASAEDCRAAVRAAHAAGFASVGVDLLFAVPGQAADDVARDLDEVLELGPDHLSWYELELKPGSALAAAGTEPVDEDRAADAYEAIVTGLEAAGYRWYETANFARPGHECRHSLAYWRGWDYVGLGVGAVSTVKGRRWRNAPGLGPYVGALSAGTAPRRTEELIDGARRRKEAWMLGLRLDEALDLDRVGPPDHPEALPLLRELGLVEADIAELRLTRRGRFLQNAVLGELMEYA